MRDIEPLLTPIRPLIPWESGGGITRVSLPLSLQTDKAGLQARRILKKLIESQSPAYETGRFREAGRPDDATPAQSSGHRRGVRELLAGK